MESNSKMFVKYAGFMFLMLMLLFYSVGSAVNKYYYHVPVTFNYLTEFKYAVSLGFKQNDITLLYFDIPDEYSDFVYDTLEYHKSEIRSDLFATIIDSLPNRIVYDIGLYYTLFAGIISVLGYLFIMNCKDKEATLKKEEYIKGARKVSEKKYCQLSHQNRDAGMVLQLRSNERLILSKQKEKEHFIILGTTGSGKSTLLISMVARLLARQTRMIIVDRKGEFWSYFGRDQDILFNPFDARGVKWSILNEINFELNEQGEIEKMPPDLQAVADYLFGVNAPNHQKNKYWYVAGAAVFCSGICHLALSQKIKNRDIAEFFSSGAENIIKAFQKLPPSLRVGLGALGEKGDSEMAGQILSMVNDCGHQLACFVGLDGGFSVREWIQKSENSNLYLSTAGRNDTSFNSIITLLIDLIGREIKEFPDDGGQDTKIVILIDELAALEPLDTLEFLLTQARSKGISVILSNQTMARIKGLYGIEEARNIMACAKSRFFFQMPEADDSKYVSATLGQYQAERRTHGTNQSSKGALPGILNDRTGSSVNYQIIKDDAFLPSDLSALKTGEAVVQLPDLLPAIAKVSLKKEDFALKNIAYEPVKVHEVAAKSIGALLKNTDVEEDPQNSSETEDIFF